MKKIIFCILICTILLCGCTGKQQQNIEQNIPVDIEENIEENKIVEKTMITPDDDSWKYEVAERLYNEFCYYYNHRNDDMSNDEYYVDYGEPVLYHSYINYNLAMAVDRATGVGVYKDYLSADKVEYVRSKRDEINNHLGAFNMLHCGYSKTGLHYMAITYSTTTNTYYSAPLCNKVRGDKNEYELMSDMYLETNFEVHDFYVEDLTNCNEYIDMNVKMYNDNVNGKTQELKRKNKLPDEALEFLERCVRGLSAIKVTDMKITLTDKDMAVIERYDRDLLAIDVTDVKNKTWNLYCFESHNNFDYIMITSYNEVTELTNYIPAF